MATPTAVRGLSMSELERIRDVLAVGRRPKVVFTEAAGQIVGQYGQVVALTDPDQSDEWVVVRFGGDELPFAPADLAIAPKGVPVKRVAAAPATPLVSGPPLLPADAPIPVPSPREETPVTRPAAKAAPASTAAKAAPASTAAKAATAATVATAAPASAAAKDVPASTAAPATGHPAARSATAEPPAADVKPAKTPARKAVRGRAPVSLTVTLSYTDGQWMVAAQQGGKALAKPYVIKAAEALRMVGMLDVPGVHDAVEEIVSAARAEAEAAADKLRAELAEIEERLAELREAP
ncbi:MAG: hypothetical protein QOE03_4026 [Micromonosporaceae bacterium]|nr:hypothetical protein [Micromonosporaceae bacterium]